MKISFSVAEIEYFFKKTHYEKPRDFAKLSLSPSLAGLSLAIYPISTTPPTQVRELKFATDTH